MRARRDTRAWSRVIIAVGTGLPKCSAIASDQVSVSLPEPAGGLLGPGFEGRGEESERCGALRRSPGGAQAARDRAFV